MTNLWNAYLSRCLHKSVILCCPRLPACDSTFWPHTSLFTAGQSSVPRYFGNNDLSMGISFYFLEPIAKLNPFKCPTPSKRFFWGQTNPKRSQWCNEQAIHMSTTREQNKDWHTVRLTQPIRKRGNSGGRQESGCSPSTDRRYVTWKLCEVV